MDAFHVVARHVTQVLRSGRIGRPVAVSMVLGTDRGVLPNTIEDGCAQAAKWLEDQPANLTVWDGRDGNRSALVRFACGGSAVISCETEGHTAGASQLCLYGNRGMVTWNAAASGVVPRGNVPTVHDDSGPVRADAASPVREPLAPPYGVLLIAGERTHQPMYAAAFAAEPRCRLIGLADSDAISADRTAQNRRLAESLQIPLLEDLDAALARDDVQIVSICAEPSRRGPIVARAAHHGKHLYLDKPLAGCGEHLELAVTAIEETRVLAHMFSSLTCPASQRLLDSVHSGTLGGLRSLYLDTCFAKGHPGTAELGRPRRETEPKCYEVLDAKRELTNVGVYPLTVLASVLSDRVCRVAAVTGNYFFREHQQRNMEDFGQILLQTEGGLLASCTAGRTGWQSHPGMGLNRVCAIGSQAIHTADGDDPHLEVWSDGSPWHPPPRNPDDPMGMWLLPTDSPFQPAPKNDRIGQAALSPSADVAYFLDCLQDGRPSIANHTVAAIASRILLAAYRSAATGTPVEL